MGARPSVWHTNGPNEYSFFNVDEIYDFLLSINMKPYVELSFMPNLLASGNATIMWYKGNITPPKSWQAWYDLIVELGTHLVDRYGIKEVSQWSFGNPLFPPLIPTQFLEYRNIRATTSSTS